MPARLLENIAEPFDALEVERIEQHGVEAARRRALEPREIEARGRRQPCALRRGDARGSAAEVAAAAQAHLDEHERVPVARDEVELAAAAPPVALDDRQAARG